jgi:hypothetical protein
MAFLRIKPIRKTSKEGKSSTYHYVYEVKSYKSEGKVKQRTVGLLGKYIILEKLKDNNFPIERALQCGSKEQLFYEIFTLNLANYGFVQQKPGIFTHKNIVANLKTCKVYDGKTGKPVYLNINGKFFGSKTLKNLMKLKPASLFDFVKSIIDSGAVCIEFSEFKNPKEEPSHSLKLLQAILDKFGQHSDFANIKDMDFDKFVKEIGY